MESVLQCSTLVYPINTAEQLHTLTWGAPVFKPKRGHDDKPTFIGLVAQAQPSQNPSVLDEGKIMLRVVTHGVCVAPVPCARRNSAYAPGTRLGVDDGWPHDPIAGGVCVLGKQHDSYQMGTLYRLLVRADSLCCC